jgi:SNF2 family DNA or RNA helicase
MPRVNLFVADGVGLGKTIEAGLIARELLLRRKVSDIVVCCPASMLLQWQEEMESRFGLIFQIIDRAFVHRIRKERGYNVNPWRTHNRFIVSHILIKDEEYTSDLRNWLGRDLVRPRSLLILDEAHNAAAGTYAITSQFTRRIMELAPKFEHRLFLSATPHNGHSNSFKTLMAILDPQRFYPGVPVRARERDQVLIYRLKEDLRDLEITFPKREVEPVLIQAPVKGTPELELAEKLEAYCFLRESRLNDEPVKIRNASAFLITTSPGTRPASNSATVESTASFSPRRPSTAVTFSTKTERRTRFSVRSSRRPRTSIANLVVSGPYSTRT